MQPLVARGLYLLSFLRLLGPVIILAFAIGYYVAGQRYPMGSLAMPGSGAVPRVLGLVLIVLAIANVVIGFFEARLPQNDGEEPRDKRWRPYKVMLTLIAFLLLHNVVGFWPSTAVALFFVLRIMGFGGVVRSLTTAVAATVACWLLFQVVLDVPFPRSPWIWWR